MVALEASFSLQVIPNWTPIAQSYYHYLACTNCSEAMDEFEHSSVEELKENVGDGRRVLLCLTVFCVTGILAFAARPLARGFI